MILWDAFVSCGVFVQMISIKLISYGISCCLAGLGPLPCSFQFVLSGSQLQQLAEKLSSLGDASSSIKTSTQTHKPTSTGVEEEIEVNVAGLPCGP